MIGISDVVRAMDEAARDIQMNCFMKGVMLHHFGLLIIRGITVRVIVILEPISSRYCIEF